MGKGGGERRNHDSDLICGSTPACPPPSQPVVGDELWIVKTLVGVPVADAEGSAWQGTHTPVFATPEAAAANDERVRLGGKYCAKGGWTPA